MQPQSGDLIFYRVDEDLISKVIGGLEHAFHEDGKVTGPGFCHVAMVASDPGLCVEMVQPWSRIRPLANDHRLKVFKRVTDATPQQVKAAIDWCYSHIGMPYNLLEYATSHWGFGPNPLQFCSVFVCHGAWKEGAGIALAGGKGKMVSPDELYESPLLQAI